MPVLDTTALIDAQHNVPIAVAALRQLAGKDLHVPPVVAAEFLTSMTDPGHDLQVLQKAYSIPATDAAWILAAASLRRELHQQVRPFRVPDMWVAAWARLLKTYVVTANARHYRAMGVLAWHYPSEAKPPK